MGPHGREAQQACREDTQISKSGKQQQSRHRRCFESHGREAQQACRATICMRQHGNACLPRLDRSLSSTTFQVATTHSICTRQHRQLHVPGHNAEQRAQPSTAVQRLLITQVGAQRVELRVPTQEQFSLHKTARQYCACLPRSERSMTAMCTTQHGSAAPPSHPGRSAACPAPCSRSPLAAPWPSHSRTSLRTAKQNAETTTLQERGPQRSTHNCTALPATPALHADTSRGFGRMQRPAALHTALEGSGGSGPLTAAAQGCSRSRSWLLTAAAAERCPQQQLRATHSSGSRLTKTSFSAHQGLPAPQSTHSAR